MCLNHDLYFFWGSSLDYPNLLEEKGCVVVVLVGSDLTETALTARAID